MRIIAGEMRGRRIDAPEGVLTRPTTDRVRESLMSAIVSRRGGFSGACVLDAFAGSGALGFEALSRGADFACFCERDKAAKRCIERNAATLRLDKARYRICAIDVVKRGVPEVYRTFDVVFLDPPYALSPADVVVLCESLFTAGRLSEEVVISYEHDCASNSEVDAAWEGSPFVLCSRRSFADTALDLLLAK